MLRLWVRIVIATSWFAPLPIISGIRLLETDLSTTIVLVLIGLVLAVLSFGILLPAHGRVWHDAEIEEKERVPYEWAAQLATFVLPFLAFRLGIVSDLLALGFIVILTILILVRSGDFVANPLLALGGYVVYRIRFKNGAEGIVIAKGKPGLRESVVSLRTIQDGLYIGRWNVDGGT